MRNLNSLLCLVVVLLFGLHVSSFSEFDTFQSYYLNGVFLQNHTIHITCEPSDFEDPQVFQYARSNGSTGTLSITCKRPYYPYIAKISGYVFEDGQLENIRACSIIDQSRFVEEYQTNYTDMSIFLDVTASPGSRNLLSVEREAPIMRYAWYDRDPHQLIGPVNEFGPGNKPTNYVRRPTIHDYPRHSRHGFVTSSRITVGSLPIDGAAPGALAAKDAEALATASKIASVAKWTTGINAIMGVTTVVMTALSFAGFGSGNSVDTSALQQQLIDLNNTMTEKLDTEHRFYTSLNNTVTAMGNALTALAQTTITINTTLTTVYNILNDTRAAQATLYNMTYYLNAGVTQKFSVVDDRLNLAEGNITNLFYLIQASTGADSALARSLANMTYNITNAINGNIDILRQGLISNQLQEYKDVQDLYSRLLVTMSIITDMQYNRPARRVQTRMFHLKNAQIFQEGRMYPFVESLGQLPNLNIESITETLVDQVRLIYIDTQIGAGDTLVQWDLVVTVNMQWFTASPPQVWKFRQLLESMGPYYCNISNIDTCQMYITAYQTKCTWNATGTPTLFNNLDTISTDAYAGCQTGTYTVGDTVLMISGSDMLAFMQYFCLAAKKPGYQVKIISGRTKLNQMADYHYEKCQTDTNMDYGSTMQPGYLESFNTWFVAFNLMQISFTQLTLQRDAFEAQLDGVLASPLTTDDNYLDNNSGQPAVCHYVYWMNYVPSLLPVYTLTRLPPVTTIEISIDGVTALQSQVIFTDPSGFVPKDQYIVIGNPRALDVYDYDAQPHMLSGYPPARANTPFYTMFKSDNVTAATLANWMTLWNTTVYDHPSGANLPAFFKRTVDPVTGYCNSSNPENPTNWCNTLSQVTLDDFIGGFAMYPRDAVYTAALNIPEGAIAQILFSSCPVATIEPTAATGYTLVLSNAKGASVIVSVSITGDCPAQYDNVDVPQARATRIWIPRCLSSTTAQPVTNVSIYYYNGTVLTACPGAINLNATVDRDAFLALYQVPDKQYTDTTMVSYADTSFIAINQAMVQIVGAIQNLTMFNTIMLSKVGYDVNVLNFTGLDQIGIAAGLAGLAMANATATNQNRPSQNYTGFIPPDLSGQFIAIQSQITGDLSTYQQQLATLSGNVAAVIAAVNQTDIAEFTRSLTAYVGALDTSDATWLAFAKTITGVVVQLGKKPDNPLAGFFSMLAGGIEEVGSDAYNAVKKVATDAYNELNPFNMFGLSGIGNTIVLVVVCIAGACAVMILVTWIPKTKWYKDKFGKNKDKTESSHDEEEGRGDGRRFSDVSGLKDRISSLQKTVDDNRARLTKFESEAKASTDKIANLEKDAKENGDKLSRLQGVVERLLSKAAKEPTGAPTTKAGGRINHQQHHHHHQEPEHIEEDEDYDEECEDQPLVSHRHSRSRKRDSF